MRSTLFTAILASGFLSTTGAHAYTIDGNLSDWGITPSNFASSTANSTTVEDQTGSGQYYLNPGYGGQAYDAEAMYLAWDSDNLYIAIITGHNPNTANTGGNYATGDIAIDFGLNGTWDYGIELKGGSGLTQGHVYANTVWSYGLWTSTGSYTSNPALADPAHPTSLVSGTDVGNGTVTYTTAGVSGYGSKTTDLHYFYEISVPLSAFGSSLDSDADFAVHWTMNCANDAILATGTIDTVTTFSVPEPGTLALLPLGLLGMLAFRRKSA
ncbi:MAG: PEP-CTERM sorting domain-containing protein [Pseudomonadota bacterium]